MQLLHISLNTCFLKYPLLLSGQGGGAGGVRGGGGGGRGRGRGRGGRDNQLLGKTIRITRGPYKGTEIILLHMVIVNIVYVHGVLQPFCEGMSERISLQIIKFNPLFP